MDTFSRAGSCCQIGKNCHISAGTGSWRCIRTCSSSYQPLLKTMFSVGAMSEVVEGVIVGEGSVL